MVCRIYLVPIIIFGWFVIVRIVRWLILKLDIFLFQNYHKNINNAKIIMACFCLGITIVKYQTEVISCFSLSDIQVYQEPSISEHWPPIQVSFEISLVSIKIRICALKQRGFPFLLIFVACITHTAEKYSFCLQVY